MKVWKKLSAVALALIMVLALGAPAFATDDNPQSTTPTTPTELTNGEVGGYEQADTPLETVQKVINLKKEITVYNPSETVVYGPAITYTYTITPAADNSGTSGGINELGTITDQESVEATGEDAAVVGDHSNGVAVTVNAVAGITTGVVVNGSQQAEDVDSAVGTLEWTNEDLLDASADGVANLKDVTIDFSNVNFGAPGVYRYKITEDVVNPTNGVNTYAAAGVIDGNNTGNSEVANIRYLDVYVMRSNEYVELGETPEGSSDPKTAYVANDWTIYGYVCVEPDNLQGIDPATTKTNGFVNSAVDGEGNLDTANSNADQYHTYNLTVSKNLESDTTMESHQFPFTVAFANETAIGTFQLSAEVTSNATANAATAIEEATTLGGESVAAGTFFTFNSVNNFPDDEDDDESTVSLKIAHDSSIKLIGIPNGTTFTVTETNNVSGTTYSTSATTKAGTANTIGDATATDVIFEAYNETNSTGSTGALSDDNMSVSINTSKTAVYAQEDAPEAGDDVEIAFTNLLSLISPTGVALRYAPYLAMLGAGVVALPLTLRKREEEI